MPLSTILKSAAGTGPFYRQKAGILSREHLQCRQTHQASWQEMVQLIPPVAMAGGFLFVHREAIPGVSGQGVAFGGRLRAEKPAPANPARPWAREKARLEARRALRKRGNCSPRTNHH